MMRLAMDARKLNEATAAQGQAEPAQVGPPVQRPARLTVVLSLGLGLGLGLGLAMLGCSETVIKHGHQFQENDLQSITSGMSQEQVRTTLGTPTTTATVGGGSAYYYISSTTGQTAFFKEVEKDRKVLAVYFNQLGSVDRVAQYGIKDGKVFNFAKQKTSTPSRDEGMIKALFRNLGAKQFSAE